MRTFAFGTLIEKCFKEKGNNLDVGKKEQQDFIFKKWSYQLQIVISQLLLESALFMIVVVILRIRYFFVEITLSLLI